MIRGVVDGFYLKTHLSIEPRRLILTRNKENRERVVRLHGICDPESLWKPSRVNIIGVENLFPVEVDRLEHALPSLEHQEDMGVVIEARRTIERPSVGYPRRHRFLTLRDRILSGLLTVIGNFSSFNKSPFRLDRPWLCQTDGVHWSGLKGSVEMCFAEVALSTKARSFVGLCFTLPRITGEGLSP